MKPKDKIIISAAILFFTFWLIYLVRSILSPFIISIALAYFLNPLVNNIAMKYKTSRLVATSIIMGFFFTTFTVLLITLLPILFEQFIDFLKAIPNYIQTLIHEVYPKIADELNRFGLNIDSDLSHLISNDQISNELTKFSPNIIDYIFSSSVMLINILSLIFITPILVFYLLKDWNLLINNIYGYLPTNVSNTTERIAKEIDRTLSGYIRGQLNVCIILGFFYSISLSFTGLNFGFLIGFFTGLLAFVPYVGITIGIITTTIIALFQWGFDASYLTAIFSIFAMGQVIESNFLTPKLVGSRIGLHPVWLIFAVFFFGAVFGFIGVLIAVPLAAICGVLVKFIALQCKKYFMLNGSSNAQ